MANLKRNPVPDEADQLNASVERITKVARDVFEHEVNKTRNAKEQFDIQMKAKQKELDDALTANQKLVDRITELEQTKV